MSFVCCVCKGRFDGGNVVILPCDHVFHPPCVMSKLVDGPTFKCPSCPKEAEPIFVSDIRISALRIQTGVDKHGKIPLFPCDQPDTAGDAGAQSKNVTNGH